MDENNTNSVENKNGKYWLIGLGIVVILLIAYLTWGKGSTPNTANNAQFPTSSSAPTAITTPTPLSATSTPGTTATTKKPIVKAPTPISATQRYLDAIKVYKNSGYYFQFLNCHASPGSLTMKSGKKFMLDNRDNLTRKLAIYKYQTFSVGAYGYVIATAPSKAGTYYVTCDGGGAASILVQN